MTTHRALSVSLSNELDERLERLASRSNRPKVELAGDAIAEFVDRETRTLDDIQDGLDDMRQGRRVPHEEAMRRLRAAAGDRPTD